MFNCTEPSYLDAHKNRIVLKNTELNRNQDSVQSKIYNQNILCDLPTNVWFEALPQENSASLQAAHRLIVYDEKMHLFASTFDELALVHVLKMDPTSASGHDNKHTNKPKGKHSSNLIVNILKTFHHPRFTTASRHH